MIAASLVGAGPAAAGGEECPKRFRCFEVTVPLDRSGVVPGTLEIPVVAQRGQGPLMIALGGGPGQGMTRAAPSIAPLLDAITGHRIAVLDQRGTGETALRCSKLQDAALSDFTVPPRGAVASCGHQLGTGRALYSTTETVADLDAVRVALGTDQVALLGISYGTYVAERYARAHPGNVSSLVLDSVVPQEDVDPLFVANMGRAAKVLEELCTRRSRCARATDDPVGDLRRLVRRTNDDPLRRKLELGGEKIRLRVDGPALFDLVAGLASLAQDRFPRFPRAVKAALRNRPKRLLALYRYWRTQNYTPDPASLSWGLHTATICADADFPWGSPASDPAGRPAATAAAASAIPRAELRPFDRETAAGNGLAATCERWPETEVTPPPEPGPLPAVPILNGTWDLSTPIEDARREARRSPTAQLAALRQLGHSTITSAECAQDAVARFYAARPLGKPCKGHRAPKR